MGIGNKNRALIILIIIDTINAIVMSVIPIKMNI